MNLFINCGERNWRINNLVERRRLPLHGVYVLTGVERGTLSASGVEGGF